MSPCLLVCEKINGCYAPLRSRLGFEPRVLASVLTRGDVVHLIASNSNSITLPRIT
jgi:hypothetical protein